MKKLAWIPIIAVSLMVLIPGMTVKAALVSYTIYTGVDIDTSSPHATVIDGDGTIWVAYRAQDGGSIDQIFVSYSEDGGENWTQEQVTSRLDDQTYPSIAVDSSDNIHLVWMGLTWGANPTFWQILHCERTPGVGWGSIELVTDVAESNRSADIAIDSSDDLHVVWYGKSWDANPTIDNIRYRKKESGVWQSHEAVTDSSSQQNRMEICIDSSDNAHVAWMGLGWGVNTAIYNVQYRIRSAAGSWGIQENVTDLPNHQYYAAFSLDSVDDTYMVWLGTGWGANPTKRQLVYNKRASGSWGSAVALTDTWDDQQPVPTLSIDQQGVVHVVWSGESWGAYPARRQLSYLRYDGSWDSRILLTDNDYNSMGANLSLDVYDGYLFSYQTPTGVMFMGDWEDPPPPEPPDPNAPLRAMAQTLPFIFIGITLVSILTLAVTGHLISALVLAAVGTIIGITGAGIIHTLTGEI